jgi:hypothetical protein
MRRSSGAERLYELEERWSRVRVKLIAMDRCDSTFYLLSLLYSSSLFYQ